MVKEEVKGGKEMNLWRELSEEEQKEFRDAARERYKPFSAINPLWHPVFIDECVKINVERGVDIPEGVVLKKKEEV